MKFFSTIARSLLTFALIAPLWGAETRVEVNRKVHLMGTVATLETYAEDREVGLGHLESFIHILEVADRELSTWKPDSVVTRLNHHPLELPFSVERSLCELLGELKDWQERTEGAFDPAIGTLIEAWGIHDGGRVPTRPELEVAMEASGLEHLNLDQDACRVVRERAVLLDVGSFGKGEALDRILTYSIEEGVSGWVVDLGGQVLVHGTPPGSDFWPVGVAHPLKRDERVLELRLRSGSLATSGGSERDVAIGDERIGHVLDPRTGLSVVRNATVTVWHEQALVADILSTALYVMGPEDGLVWAEANGVTACFLVPDESGEVHLEPSREFSELFLVH